MIFSVGRCFLYQPDGAPSEHFSIIIHYAENWPKPGVHSYILVNATTKAREYHCLLDHKDHIWFKYPSPVNYQWVTEADRQQLEMHLKENPRFRLSPDRISAAAVSRIQAGLHISTVVKPKYCRIVPNPALQINNAIPTALDGIAGTVEHVRINSAIKTPIRSTPSQAVAVADHVRIDATDQTQPSPPHESHCAPSAAESARSPARNRR